MASIVRKTKKAVQKYGLFHGLVPATFAKRGGSPGRRKYLADNIRHLRSIGGSVYRPGQRKG